MNSVVAKILADYERLLAKPITDPSAEARLLAYLQQAIVAGVFARAEQNLKLRIEAMQKALVFALNSGGGASLLKWHAVFFRDLSPNSATKIKATPQKTTSNRKFDISKKLPAEQRKQSGDSLAGDITYKTPQSVQSQHFDYFKTGAFANLLGKVCLPFSLIISGKPGSGKTTFFMQLIRHTCLNYPQDEVLFVSNEEGFSPSMAEKLKRFDFSQIHNLAITEELPRSLKKYRFVFVDSVNSLRMDLEKFKQIIAEQDARGGAFLAIMQATKQGRYKGASEFEHYPSISLSADAGVIENVKNRFGGSGEYCSYRK